MKLITHDARRDLWLLLAIAAILIGAGIGLRDPWPADEPRFVLAARQMLESGHWLFPMRGDELYPDKPPLFMWALACATWLLGSWRLGFLLPSLLAALGTLWLVQDLGRRLWNRRIGLYAAYALLFTLQFTLQAKRAQIDAAVAFLITLSVYGLLRHVLCGPSRPWAIAGGFAAGLGVITKGVGVLGLLVLVPAAVTRRMHWSRTRDVGAVTLGLVVFAFLGAIALWLLPMLHAVTSSTDPALQAYADNILLRQTAQRYAQSWHHHQPPWYFLEVIATAWLPVALALPWALPAWWRRIRRHDARQAILLGFVALLLLFFSIPSGKRDVYILPALPVFCLALAPLLPGLLRKRAVRRTLLGFLVLLGALALAGGAAALFAEPGFEVRLEADRDLDAGADHLWWLLGAIGGAILSVALLARARYVLAGMIGALFVLWLGLSLIAYPLLDGGSSARSLMRDVGDRIGPDAELGLVAWKEQNLLQADRSAVTFGFRRSYAAQRRSAIAWLTQAPERRWVMILDEAMGDCIDPGRAIEAGRANRRAWWLFRLDAVRAECR